MKSNFISIVTPDRPGVNVPGCAVAGCIPLKDYHCISIQLQPDDRVHKNLISMRSNSTIRLLTFSRPPPSARQPTFACLSAGGGAHRIAPALLCLQPGISWSPTPVRYNRNSSMSFWLQQARSFSVCFPRHQGFFFLPPLSVLKCLPARCGTVFTARPASFLFLPPH